MMFNEFKTYADQSKPNHLNKRNCKYGFTLIEVIMATSLSALVITGAFASLTTILTSYRSQETRYDATNKAHLILAQMSKDITAAYFSPHRPMTRFVGTDNQTDLFDTDTLTFISTVNNTINTGQGSSDLAEVQYYIDLDPSTPEKWLLRRYDVTPDMDPFTGGTLSLLGPEVVSLNFEYYDGFTWWPSWDSAEELPRTVNITIGIFKPKHPNDFPTFENVEFFSKMVWIANYRHIPASELTGAMGSTTPEEEAAEEEANAAIESSGGGGGGGNQGGGGGR